ncbi:patatin-like protein [Saccharopolyspora gloriosae]|uniref:patatin-like protein n=1 Tax=Saccharopolyspora gloriosae TaxID=455344 RepID=UPI001FB69DBF|nr:patatin-like protein [Saccharopolyspora gloriosae]
MADEDLTDTDTAEGGRPENGSADAENDQELRLALAMRGGASLAVWIGGAVAEIDLLRCATSGPESGSTPGAAAASGTAKPGPAKPDDEHPWSALAGLAGYDSVSVDVLAGASAGGLNATLLSASIVYGMPFEDMRELWVRLADLEAMCRAVPKFWQRRPDSLLEGDGYFRAELARLITELTPAPKDARNLGHRLDLLLTATLLDPVLERHFDGRSGALTEQRRTATFRFRHRGRSGQPLSDFGTGKEFPATALRLAQAARATSSFPFAFEPAQVHSSTGTPPPGEPDMFGVFSENTADPRPYRVIDGGVLDNIPVTAAVEAMAEVPTERPSARWLLYLNPEPETVGEGRPLSRQLALPVASTALSARMSQESLLADIHALDEHNAAVQRTELRRRSVFAPLLPADPAEQEAVLFSQVEQVEAEYAVVRAELDAQAVLRLLVEPAGTEDGRLLPPVVGDPLDGWSPQVRTVLGRRLSTGLAGLAAAEPNRVFDDVRGLSSGVQECLDWARDIGRWAAVDQLPVIGGCKSALYRLRTFAEVLEGHADRYWINGAVLEPIVELGELADWVLRVAERRERVQHRLPSPVRPLLGAVLNEVEQGTRFQRALEDFAAELESMADSSGADAVPWDEHGVDAIAEARVVLHRIADRLAAAAPPRTRSESPAQIGYGLLERTERRPDVLRALVVLTAPLDVGRSPGDRINFLRVVSDAPSPLPFDALRNEGQLRVEDKVRGGDLANFGAFLSARWRANDWMWGRLDAASALVGLLLVPARLLRHSAELGPEGIAERLRVIVTTPTRAELGETANSERWQGFLTELWTRHADQVRAELAAMFADPVDEHPLTETKALVVERLHWTIAAQELPFVATVAAGADPAEPRLPDIPEPQRLTRDVERYSVGKQRVVDLGEPRLASVATRSALVAYRAVRPGTSGVLRLLGRVAMTLIKPVLLLAVLAVAAPRRVALILFLGATAVALSGVAPAGTDVAPHMREYSLTCPAEAPPPDATMSCLLNEPATAIGARIAVVPHESSAVTVLRPFTYDPFTMNLGVLLALLVAAVSALWLGFRLAGHGKGLARWLPAVFIAAAMTTALLWTASSGFTLGPQGLVLAAVLLTWLGSLGLRPLGRAVAAVLSAVVFAGAMWLAEPAVGAVDWLLPASIVAAYAHMVLLSTVDLLRPRPRPERSEPGARPRAKPDSARSDAVRAAPATGG